MNPTLTVWLQLMGLLAVEVAVIVGIAAQLQRLTKSAIWRRTIWHSCILSLLLLVVFEFTGAARGMVVWIRQKPASATQLRNELRAPSGNHATRNTQQSELPDARQIITQANAESSIAPAPHNPIATKLTGAVAASESPSVLWFGLVWLAGTGVVIGRALFSRIVLEIFRWQSRGVDHVDLRESVPALALRLGIRRQVRLMESVHVPAPVAFGILRPTIGLPPQFGLKFNSVQQDAMLAHELAHLAGNDPAWYLLADILTAALWWHPLIWWSRRQLQAQSELAADEASLLVADGPGVLAECLVELGARLAQTRSLIPMGMAGPGYRSGLGRRVERLVKLEGAVWRPPNRIRCGLARTMGPVALVTAAILCTAWVVPPALTKGENMQTMRQTWKKSLAAFALLTAFGSNGNPALADTTDAQTVTKPAGSPTLDYHWNYTADSQTAAKPEVVTQAATDMKPSGQSSGGNSTAPASPHHFQDRLSNIVRVAPAQKNSKEQQLLREKLTRITLPSIKYDGLPLGDVINNLVETSAKLDPDKQGINFVMNREAPAPAPPAIDPTTGLPLPAEPIDWSSVTVKISPALKNVRLIDVLDIITKTADRPIRYSIEDYGVLFSLGAAKPAETQSAKSLFGRDSKPLPESMEAMTFMIVNTKGFFTSMERTFGITLQSKDRAHMTPSEMKHTIEVLFEKLKIDMSAPNKMVFFNDVTGVLMVRGTSQDLDVIKAAIQTLGGMPMSWPQATATLGAVPSNPAER